MVDVARRINARPKTPGEWDEIEAEIVKIQRLTPNIWYGEYLRNKVAEVRRGGRRLSLNRITWSCAARRPMTVRNNSSPNLAVSRVCSGNRAPPRPAPGQPSDALAANIAEQPLELATIINAFRARLSSSRRTRRRRFDQCAGRRPIIAPFRPGR